MVEIIHFWVVFWVYLLPFFYVRFFKIETVHEYLYAPPEESEEEDWNAYKLNLYSIFKMKNIRKKSRSIINFITKLDVYGKPISLSYEGSETFQTGYGGLATIATFIVLLTYAI